MIKIGEAQCADGALSVVEDSVLILELAGVACGIKGMGGVVTITSNENVLTLTFLAGALRANSIAEAR